MLTTKLKSHVLYTRHQAIKEICAPLAFLNISGFIFMRHFSDNTFIDLSNQLEWSDFFLDRYMKEKYLNNMLADHMYVRSDVSLWSNNPNNIIWKEGVDYFGFGNGVTITEKNESYKDVCCFYANYNDYHMSDFYLGNIDLLKKFIAYFKVKASDIIAEGEKERLVVPQRYLEIPQSVGNPGIQFSRHDFLSAVDEHYRRVAISQKLSAREIQCVLLCATGKSAKQIGSTLCISPRTVETHLNKAKIKLGCINLSELIAVVLRARIE